MTNRFKLVLQDSIDISPTVRHFVFTREDGEKLDYKAGQFISLHLEKDGKECKRNYSIANIDITANTLELALAYVDNGLASTKLFNMQPGDTIDASGPYGIFVLKDEPVDRYILVATGTGVTPYRSMLEQLKQLLKTNIKIELFFGARTPADAIYKDDFTALATEFTNFNYTVCYSREMPEDTNNAVKGYVQEQFKALDINPEVTTDICYLCGNPNMVDDAFQALQELGIERKKIRREKYISAK